MTGKLLTLPFEAVTRLTLMASVILAFFSAVSWLAAKEAILIITPIVIFSFGIMAILAGLVALLSFIVVKTEWLVTRRAELRRDTVVKTEWLATRRAELRRDRTMARNEARQSNIASNRAQVQMVAEARLLGATIKQVERGMIHPAALGDGKFSSFPAKIINQIEQAAVPLLEAPPQPLLPAIANCDNVLIVGGRGSGKTTLLRHLEIERLQRGQTIALDSHAVPGQWSGQYVGAGRKYATIKSAMIALIDKMDSRHNERTRGCDSFKAIHTIIDEFTLLPGFLKKAADYNIQDYSFPMLTEGRKVEMTCLWGTHSDRAKPLGFEGVTDLKECFDVLVYLKKVKGNYYAICDFGEGKEDIRYTLPVPFATTTQNIQSLPATTTTITPRIRPSVLDMPMARPPTAHEQAVLDAAQQATSFNGLHHLVSGTQTNVSSNQIEKYKGILQKFGVNPSF